MSTPDRMAGVIATLDWDGDLGPPMGEEAEGRLAPLGEGATRWVRGAVEQSLAALHRQIDDSLAPWPLIRAFARQVLTATLLRLADQDGPPVDRTSIDRTIAGDVVARDIPLPDITRALRSLQREWLSLLIDAVVRARPEGIQLVPALVTSVTGTMDDWVGAATDALAEERRRIDLAEQVRVRGAIEALIAARPLDRDAAGRLLRIPLVGWHLGCAIGVSSEPGVERRVLDGLVHAFTRAVGSGRVSRYETNAGTVHLWITADRLPQPPRIADLHVPPALLVGLGEPHPGVDGFRRTFLEASDALELAAGLGRDGGLSYGDAALASVLSRDPERARWFVEHELHDLARNTPEMAEMRNTLTTFFDTRMRIAPAAERLFLHRNTLINRLERIQALLGHGVAERSAETQAALALTPLFARPPDAGPAGADRRRD